MSDPVTPPSAEAALRSQLQYLNDRMKETSDTANQFLGKFLFGGIVAVIALLNADLVVLSEPITLSDRNLFVLAGSAIATLLISAIYFRSVVRHYASFRVSHRKLKYKYEVTLHALLSGGTASEYAHWLERSVDEEPTGGFVDEYPRDQGFEAIADYLLQHHRKAWSTRLKPKRRSMADPYFVMAMWLVVLTLAVRASLLLLN